MTIFEKKKSLLKCRILCVYFSVSAFSFPVFASGDSEKTANVEMLTDADTSSWQEKTFKGHTIYEFMPDEGGITLKAQCNGTASAFYKGMAVDLTKTPYLHWSWKIDGTHSNLDDVSKGGDDYAARVYVVYRGELLWQINAMNYVWANKQEKDASWKNAYSERAMMIAQESGEPENKDKWVNETRDVRHDFKEYFGLDVRRIEGVAVMTDCDNGGGTATGYYRDIVFTNKP